MEQTAFTQYGSCAHTCKDAVASRRCDTPSTLSLVQQVSARQWLRSTLQPIVQSYWHKLFSQWHKIKQEKKTETQATNLYSQILSAREGKAMGVQWAHS